MTTQTDIEAGIVGAQAALETFAEMLADYAATHEFDADAPCFSLNDLVRLVGVARGSIEGMA